MGDRHRSSLEPAPGLETVELVPKVSPLGFSSCVRGLHQRGLQIDIALGDAAALTLAGGVARRNGLSLARK
jgi:hypothetical protein